MPMLCLNGHVAAHEKCSVKGPISQCSQLNRHGWSCFSVISDIWWSSWLCIPVLMSVLLKEGVSGNSDLVWTDAGH